MKDSVWKDKMCLDCKYNTEEYLEYRNEGGNEYYVCDRAEIHYGECQGKEKEWITEE